MDSLTQAALGAAVGELLLGRKLGWHGAAWGAFLGTLPDLDIVVMPFLDEASAIRWHRGLSHSLLAIVVMPLLLAWPLARLHRKRGLTVREAGWMTFWVWGTHVLIDCFNSYGTQIFEPFSDRRVGIGNLFIIDPLFTVPLLLGLVLALASRRESRRRGLVMRWALGLSAAYAVLTVGMKLRATGEMREWVAGELRDARLVAVSPTALNTVLWRGLAETPEGYHVLYWSPFDREREPATFIPKQRGLVAPFAGEELLGALEWFSEGHWVARRGEDDAVVFIDMRFGEIREGDGREGTPIFQWHLRREGSGTLTAPMRRPEVDRAAALGLVWQRMWGDHAAWSRVRPF